MPGRCADGTDLAEAIAPLIPDPVDHVLLQADLTAVAPGPLLREVYDELAAMADVESHGGAGVFRFSDASVRRALDLGKSSEDLHRWLAEHSRTPVPQPLSYLIDDVARRHGVLRLGTASTYLRCDDEATISGLLTAGPPGVAVPPDRAERAGLAVATGLRAQPAAGRRAGAAGRVRGRRWST